MRARRSRRTAPIGFAAGKRNTAQYGIHVHTPSPARRSRTGPCVRYYLRHWLSSGHRIDGSAPQGGLPSEIFNRPNALIAALSQLSIRSDTACASDGFRRLFGRGGQKTSPAVRTGRPSTPPINLKHCFPHCWLRCREWSNKSTTAIAGVNASSVLWFHSDCTKTPVIGFVGLHIF